MKRKASISLQNRIIIILLCILLPVVLLVNLYAVFIYSNYAGQVADLNRMSLRGYNEGVAAALDNAESAMKDIIGGNYDFRTLTNTLPPLDAYVNTYSASAAAKSAVAAQPNIGCVAIFSPPNNMYYPVWPERIKGPEHVQTKEAVRQFVLGWSKDDWNTTGEGWQVVEVGGTAFLYKVMYHKNALLFCFMDLDNLAAQGDRPVAFLQDGEYLTQTAAVQANQLAAPDPAKPYTMAGSPAQYMLLGQALPGTALQSVYLLEAEKLYEGFGGFQTVLIVLSVATILLVPLGYWWLARALFRPLGELVRVMETAAGGDLAVRSETRYPERELRTMSETFNGMMDQIGALKIESYEKELAARQAQLSFLQMQIRPHFYLNCLKNIYGLAQQQQYDDIQKMLVLLSDYLRYMMQCDRDWVTLEEELQNSRNYIRLVQYNMAYPPACNISVDTAALNDLIPPITILSFVENSIKYAKPEAQLEVSIRARHVVTEDGPMLVLTVQDNGKGFPPEQLERMNRLEEQPPERAHVGLYNVWMRLRLLYQDKQGIVFSNEGGARIEIFLPIGPSVQESKLLSEESETDDSADC